LNVAIPTILREFDTTLPSLEWVVTGYALTFATLLIIGGRLGDVYGHRRIFVIGAALFGAGSSAIGSALETTLSHGVPRDDVFLYEDALRRGRSVVVVVTEDESLAERARDTLRAAGGTDIGAARDDWWAGLREEDRGVYTPEEESAYRRGFEAALTSDAREPGQEASAAFRRGWERGLLYRGHARRLPKSA